MRNLSRWVAVVVVALLVYPGHAARAQDVPDFIQVGKKYMFGVFGMMDQETGAEVVEIGQGPWIKVRIEDMDHPIWLNLNTVSLAIEVTPEFQAFMDDQRGTTMQRAYEAAMKSDLRNLVTAEEAYFADNLAYTAKLEDLGFTASSGVSIHDLAVAADGNGWSATATHSEVSVSCSIYVGSAADAAGVPDGSPQCGS